MLLRAGILCFFRSGSFRFCVDILVYWAACVGRGGSLRLIRGGILYCHGGGWWLCGDIPLVLRPERFSMLGRG